MIESIKQFFSRILDFIRNLFKKSNDLNTEPTIQPDTIVEENTEQQVETIFEIEADDGIILDITDIILVF